MDDFINHPTTLKEKTREFHPKIIIFSEGIVSGTRIKFPKVKVTSPDRFDKSDPEKHIYEIYFTTSEEIEFYKNISQGSEGEMMFTIVKEEMSIDHVKQIA